MQTAIENKKGDKILILTQQYEVGLYIAIYDADSEFKTVGIPSQTSSKQREEAYHKWIRKKVEELGDIVNKEHSTEL